MNKFLSQLTNSSDKVIQTRANHLSQLAKLEQENLINGLSNRLLTKKFELEKLNDMNPETSVSLRPGGENFNPQAWVSTNQRMKLEIIDLEVELATAKDTYTEFFAEEAPVAGA
jgi:hypothetical protein